MAAVDVVRARIDPTLKKEATEALAKMGLSVSDAIRLLMIRIAAEKALPFEILIPNPETEMAMCEAMNDKGKRFKDIEALMKDLEN